MDQEGNMEGKQREENVEDTVGQRLSVTGSINVGIVPRVSGNG